VAGFMQLFEFVISTTLDIIFEVVFVTINDLSFVFIK
jgi:hypothetical protein